MAVMATLSFPTLHQSVLDSLAALERLAGLELLPAADGAGLDAEHVLVAVVGLEVGHAGGLVDPRVPHDNVLKAVAHHGEDPLLVLAALLADHHRNRRVRGRRVHPVRLARDGDSAGLRLSLGCVHLVDVRGVLETGHFYLGDVL